MADQNEMMETMSIGEIDGGGEGEVAANTKKVGDGGCRTEVNDTNESGGGDNGGETEASHTKESTGGGETENKDTKESKGEESDDKFEPEHVRKLFVNNLNYSTTNESLRKEFERWGEVVDAVVVRYPGTDRSRGFGYIRYATDEMVDTAQRARPHRVDGRFVLTKRALPRFDIKRPEANASVKRLYVSGLVEEVDEDILAAYFRGFGKICNISVVKERATGKKRGFAYVEFDDFDTVDKICLMKSHSILDKVVEVKKALTQFEMAKMYNASRGDRDGGGDRGGSGGRGGGSVRGGGGSGNGGGYGAVTYESPWAHQSGGGNQGGQNWGNGNFGGFQQNNGPGPIRDNFRGNTGRPGPYQSRGNNFTGGGGNSNSGYQNNQNWGNSSFGNGPNYNQGNNYGGGNFGGGNFGGGRGQNWSGGGFGGGSQPNGSGNFGGGGRGGYGGGQNQSNNSFGGGGNFVGGGGRGGFSEDGDQQRSPLTPEQQVEFSGALIEVNRKTGVVSFEISRDCYQKARFRREDASANGLLVDQSTKLTDIFRVGMEAKLLLKEFYLKPMDPTIPYVAKVDVNVPPEGGMV